MSLNFPASPTPGDTFTSEGVTFVWTGTVWVIPPAGLRFATEAEARGGVALDLGMSPLRGAQAIDEFDAPPSGAEAAPAALCVAMCIFNGATGAIISEGNIASLTVLGTGLYTLTFETPLIDANYIVLGSALGITNHPVLEVGSRNPSQTVGAAVVQVGTTGGQFADKAGFLVASALVHVGVFR